MLEGFAEATSVLAEEREEIEALIGGLGDLATVGNELVAAHEEHLPEDLAQLSRAGRAARANVEALVILVQALAANSRGLIGAHDTELGVLTQRINLTPLTAEVLRPLFDALGIRAPAAVRPRPGGGVPMRRSVLAAALLVTVALVAVRLLAPHRRVAARATWS